MLTKYWRTWLHGAKRTQMTCTKIDWDEATDGSVLVRISSRWENVGPKKCLGGTIGNFSAGFVRDVAKRVKDFDELLNGFLVWLPSKIKRARLNVRTEEWAKKVVVGEASGLIKTNTGTWPQITAAPGLRLNHLWATAPQLLYPENYSPSFYVSHFSSPQRCCVWEIIWLSSYDSTGSR